MQEPQLSNFWDRLKTVKDFTLHVHSGSKSETRWNGRGKVSVLVSEDATTITFLERGSWQGERNANIAFSNTVRWIFDRSVGMISLEHLRFGPRNPVFLFHLIPTEIHRLASMESHLCKEDEYLAQVAWDWHSIRLSYRVIGPKKNEEIEYFYIIDEKGVCHVADRTNE